VREPARLEAMIKLWWSEAEKHNVLPLDDRFGPRFAGGVLDSPPARGMTPCVGRRRHVALRNKRNLPYLIFSYAAAKSASGIGIEMVSLAIFWNDTFNCLPDFNAVSTSGEICRLA